MNPYEMDEYYDDDDYVDEIENAAEDCGQSFAEPGECAFVGTEYCDFQCPFSRVDLYGNEESENE